MAEAARILAFILIILGTAGLLVNEFFADLSQGATITFASLNVVGLVILAYTSWITTRAKAK